MAVLVVMALLRTGDAKAVSDNAAIIGALVALGGVFTAQMVSIALENQRTQEARDIEKQRTQEVALKQYFEQMAELVEKGLRDCPEDDEKRVLARTLTLLVLRDLDPHRKWLFLDFLYDSKLLNRAGPIVSLASADFRDGVFNEYLSYSAADSADVRKYLGDSDPKNYLSKGDLSSVLSKPDSIPEPVLQILLYQPMLTIELEHADLQSAILMGAYLRGGILNNTNLQDAHLVEADLIGAELPNACLRNADLRWAVLIGADLTNAELAKANFEEAVLIQTDLREAILREASLFGTVLSGADLSGADLSGAIGITNEELEQQAYSLEGAIMPDGSIHP